MATRKLDASRQSTKAKALASKFEKLIIGQTAAKKALINLLDKHASGLYDKTCPIGSLLFLGPTGTGKTGTVEGFVEGLFGLSTKMMKVDCAEFQHSHEIAKLVGSPPGYLGHRETHPFFTNASLLAARLDNDGREIVPFTVILFDEIEKASDALWNLLLGILDKGTLTTGTNERVDMTATIIVMTSNVGAAELADDSALGFSAGEKVVDDEKMQAVAMAAARKKFLPEFLNRLDHVIMFKTLTPANLREIASLMLQKVQDRILFNGANFFELRVTDAAMEQLLSEGYDRRYNARHLKRTIEKYVAEPLTRIVATGQVMDGDIVTVGFLPEWKDWTYSATTKSTSFNKSGGLSS
jgi:ATP-dependent Clp protease ATP-binding subunit ClpB